MTIDFCTISVSATGAPGTAKPGKNGCISNCGVDIVKGSPPAEFKSIAYFEGFNGQRGCDNVDISNVNLTKYTHIRKFHLLCLAILTNICVSDMAFASITPDFQVDISATQQQFDEFVLLTGVKKVPSFGGWSFSTNQDTSPIFQSSVTSATKQRLLTI